MYNTKELFSCVCFVCFGLFCRLCFLLFGLVSFGLIWFDWWRPVKSCHAPSSSVLA